MIYEGLLVATTTRFQIAYEREMLNLHSRSARLADIASYSEGREAEEEGTMLLANLPKPDNKSSTSASSFRF